MSVVRNSKIILNRLNSHFSDSSVAFLRTMYVSSETLRPADSEVWPYPIPNAPWTTRDHCAGSKQTWGNRHQVLLPNEGLACGTRSSVSSLLGNLGILGWVEWRPWTPEGGRGVESLSIPFYSLLGSLQSMMGGVLRAAPKRISYARSSSSSHTLYINPQCVWFISFKETDIGLGLEWLRTREVRGTGRKSQQKETGQRPAYKDRTGWWELTDFSLEK